MQSGYLAESTTRSVWLATEPVDLGAGTILRFLRPVSREVELLGCWLSRHCSIAVLRDAVANRLHQRWGMRANSR